MPFSSQVERLVRLIVSMSVVSRFAFSVPKYAYLLWIVCRLLSGTWTDPELIPLMIYAVAIIIRPRILLSLAAKAG